MADLSHLWGNDLVAGANGDLLGVDETSGDLALQLVLRRLLTNAARPRPGGGPAFQAGDYLAHQEYGAGLPAKVGSLLTPNEIRAIVRGQLALEQGIARIPEPIIDVSAIAGGVFVQIRYNDALNGTAQVLAFNVNL